MRSIVTNYLSELQKSLDLLPLEQIEALVGILYDAYRGEKRVFIMGNGGSAATALHFVCDLAKGTSVPNQRRFKVVGLNDNVPLVTAWANDASYEDVFREQLANWIEEGDVVIAISASGNSQNVLNGIEYANTRGALTVGLTGFEGGKLRHLVKECFVVPSDNMERIEDIHLVIVHMIKLCLRCAIEKGGFPR